MGKNGAKSGLGTGGATAKAEAIAEATAKVESENGERPGYTKFGEEYVPNYMAKEINSLADKIKKAAKKSGISLEDEVYIDKITHDPLQIRLHFKAKDISEYALGWTYEKGWYINRGKLRGIEDAIWGI